MLSRSTLAAAAAGALVTSSAALAQPFQIVGTIAPPFSIPESQWKNALRFSLTGSGSAATPISSIPNGQVHDPVGVAFRTPTDLFIGNRHGNSGQTTVSRFKLTNGGADATFVNEFSQPGMVGIHEIAFNPVTHELFCATLDNGIWRFTFDSLGQPVAHGSFALGRPWRGLCIEPTGNYLYASQATNQIIRFRINPDQSMTELTPYFVPGGNQIHFFSQGPSQTQIYACDIFGNAVFRLNVAPDGGLSLYQTIPCVNAIDCTFSPAGNEMYVARHISGNIDRFTYNSGADTWTFTNSIATDSMGCVAAYVPAACPADLTGEGFVDDSDFVIFVQAYNILDCEDASMPLGCPADFNLDGLVDDSDFVIFVAAYDALVCS
ncbi:MAG: hypothetical protein ACREJD_16450 [Phycisphaerales bacterium]